MLTEYQNWDATEIAKRIADGDVSATEVLETAISLAESINPDINAIVATNFEAVLAGDYSGPLAGVPFLIKDLVMVEGIRCSMGSRLWHNFVPDHDSELVRRYKNAGLAIIGKSNTPEVGLAATTESTFLGPCRNPFDLDRTTGGSSGGAAAAVAAGILPVAHATDGGGSIRIPASCCGLVGLKPTRGRVSLGPDVGEGWGTMASAHVVSRTVRDSALLLDVSHGPAPGDPYHPPFVDYKYADVGNALPKGLRIGIDMTPASGFDAPIHPECVLAVENASKQLEQLGHHVAPIDLQFDRGMFSLATNCLVMANVAHTILTRAEMLGIAPEKVSDHIETNTMNGVAIGQAITGRDYAKAIAEIQKVGRYVESRFDQVDLILSPALLSPPVPLGFMNTDDGNQERYGEHIQQFWGFTHLYNGTGHPAISLPLHWTEANLPVGVQFAARFGDERLLLQLGAQLEQAMPWKSHYTVNALGNR